MHVGGHSRGGRHGAVDVSAYDRSPPGGGAANQVTVCGKDRVMRSSARAIAKAERSAEHRNHGYRQYNDAGGGRGAFGRYQLRHKVLIDAGWMDKLGRWTGKAASFGVRTDTEFLDRPEAQETAMSDVLRVYDRQVSALGLDKYVGQVITGLDGSNLRLTRAGIIAAGHREGVSVLSDYLRRRVITKKAPNEQSRKRDIRVDRRLRGFEDFPYEPHR